MYRIVSGINEVDLEKKVNEIMGGTSWYPHGQPFEFHSRLNQAFTDNPNPPKAIVISCAYKSRNSHESFAMTIPFSSVVKFTTELSHEYMDFIDHGGDPEDFHGEMIDGTGYTVHLIDGSSYFILYDEDGRPEDLVYG